MKFGKELRKIVDSSFEAWRPMFMSYKTLKKLIERPLPGLPVGPRAGGAAAAPTVTAAAGVGGEERVVGVSPAGMSDADVPGGGDVDLGRGSDVDSGRSGEGLGEGGAPAVVGAATTLPPREASLSRARAGPSAAGVGATPASATAVAGGGVGRPGACDAAASSAFFACLRSDVNKVNDFYLNQEEEVIILFHLLAVQVDEVITAAVAAASTAAPDAAAAAGASVASSPPPPPSGDGAPGATGASHVTPRPAGPVGTPPPAVTAAVAAAAVAAGAEPLRGRLVALTAHLRLLANFAAVNYTGFYKILKKYDKKTGRSLRHTYLTAVLATPFFQSSTVRTLLVQAAGRIGQLDGLLRGALPDGKRGKAPAAGRLGGAAAAAPAPAAAAAAAAAAATAAGGGGGAGAGAAGLGRRRTSGAAGLEEPPLRVAPARRGEAGEAPLAAPLTRAAAAAPPPLPSADAGDAGVAAASADVDRADAVSAVTDDEPRPCDKGGTAGGRRRGPPDGDGAAAAAALGAAASGERCRPGPPAEAAGGPGAASA